MRKVLTVLAILVPVTAHASECKGLFEDQCKVNSKCYWVAAIKQGEKSPRTGQVYKISRKAYCRAKPGNTVTK